MRSREWAVGCVFYDPADDDDVCDDPLVHAVVAMVIDPFYGKPVPPSPYTAADIIARAEAKMRHPPGDTTAEQRELARVEQERRAAALLAAMRDDRLARRLRGRWWYSRGRRYERGPDGGQAGL